MRVALAQIDPTIGDFSGNLSRIKDFAERAVTAGADVVVFPELALCGYPPADLLEKNAFLDRARSSLDELRAWTAGDARPAIVVGTAVRNEGAEGKHARNVAVVLDGGEQVFEQGKKLLPFYDVFDEQRYFEPAEWQWLFRLRGQTIALTICEDAWNDKIFWPERRYAVDPVDDLMAAWPVEERPRFILNISASPYWKDKRGVREEMLGALARRHDAVVAMVNQVGGNDSLVFDGSSLVVGCDGAVVARGRSFAEDLVVFDVGEACAGGLSTAEAQASDVRDEIAATWDALVLGTRDYLRKCGFHKALVGLSGGIDSALVAAIAVEALGAENVNGIGMPSEFSSGGSIEDARALAENLGIRFDLLPIRSVFDNYMRVLDTSFAGTPFGLAEENLQARIRGALLMAMSNKTGANCADDGQQERDVDGVLHAVRRHGGWPRGHR